MSTPPHCTSDTTATHLLALLLGDLITLCCFLTSHPLSLTYLLLFSPYLLPLLSFLSPLIISTSFLLLFTLLIHSPFPPLEFPGYTFRALLRILTAGLGGEAATSSIEQFDSKVRSPIGNAPLLDQVALALLGVDGVLEWDFITMGGELYYKNSSPICESGHNPFEPGLPNSEKKSKLLGSEVGIGYRGTADEAEPGQNVADEAPLECRPILRLDHGGGGSRHGISSRTLADNLGENLSRSTSMRLKTHVRRASEGIQRDSSMRKDALQRDGSMRKEKEWKRTLACKLYEERVTFRLCEQRTVVDNGEEMDFLWEAYEKDANKTDTDTKSKKNKGKNWKKEEIEEEESVEDEGEGDESVGRLCCLQALRLSAGKMNLGVGRPNLVKVSKILKGIGLFQSVRSRNGKKK